MEIQLTNITINWLEFAWIGVFGAPLCIFMIRNHSLAFFSGLLLFWGVMYVSAENELSRYALYFGWFPSTFYCGFFMTVRFLYEQFFPMLEKSETKTRQTDLNLMETGNPYSPPSAPIDD